MTKPWYQRCYRRMLVDMHIADWDKAFLSKYDPVKMADLYEKTGLTSVMFYCQSHVGLCYWPTKSGKMHSGLKGRDVVGEMARELKRRNIASCAYYSVVFNVWAFTEHPEWRINPAGSRPADAFGNFRPGLCCPNNPEYRAFALAQTKELVGSYDFDGFFFDMTFWPGVCLCPHCRKRYRDETGEEIPRVVNWASPDWCTFQAARERWMKGFAGELTATVKRLKPNMSVYHNFASAFFDWTFGLPLDSAEHHDFLGADFYGGPVEQLMVSKVMLHLSENQPAEFMTSRCTPSLHYHVRLKSYEELEVQAFASTLFSSAFLFIDAVNVDGTVNENVYERFRKIYASTARYEPYLGGVPVEDVAIYYSSDSKTDFAENGMRLSEAHGAGRSYAHVEALRSACRILQENHLPFGVITRKQLAELNQFKVIVLPNVTRMSQEEAAAFRSYVRRGGKLYASYRASLTETRGVRHDDFMLADVFGCHCDGEVGGFFAYMKPCDAETAACIAPQDYLCLGPAGDLAWRLDGPPVVRALRLKPEAEGTVLGTLTLPYAHPERGTVFDRNWASFHSWPPYEDTAAPLLVRNSFGKGEGVYSGAAIESLKSEASDRLFLRLIRSLMGGEPSYSAETHPAVWMNVFHQPEKNRLLVGFLNYQDKLPVIPIRRVPFSLKAPAGMKFSKLLLLPDEKPVEFTTDADGTLHAEAQDLGVFQMLMALTE